MVAETGAAHETARDGAIPGCAPPGPEPPIRAVTPPAAVRANEGRRGEGFRASPPRPRKGLVARRAEVSAQAVRVNGASTDDAAAVAPHKLTAATGLKEGAPVMGGRPPRGAKPPLVARPGARARQGLTGPASRKRVSPGLWRARTET